MSETVLEIEDLRVEYRPPRGVSAPVVHAVNGASLAVSAGSLHAIVGESGCGKSATALSVLGLLPPGGVVAGGAIRFQGADIARLGPRHIRGIRGREIAMIFQDALSALNPTFTIGSQIAELLRVRRGRSRSEARRLALEALTRVGVSDPAARLRQYPHELSGGLRQRVMIAMAVAMQPRLLIADEPTTALDVTVQQQVMDLLDELRRDMGMTVVLITHDLGVVARYADSVSVMYCGRVIEDGTVTQVLEQPGHPYTQGLIGATPRVDQSRNSSVRSIPGAPPTLTSTLDGCAFEPRCSRAGGDPACCSSVPELHVTLTAGHLVACHKSPGPEVKQ